MSKPPILQTLSKKQYGPSASFSQGDNTRRIQDANASYMQPPRNARFNRKGKRRDSESKPTEVGGQCDANSSSCGEDWDPLEDFQHKVPAPTALEIANALNRYFGLVNEPQDMSDVEEYDGSECQEAAAECDVLDNCIFGDHSYAARPDLADVDEASTEKIVSVVEPVGDVMYCSICEVKFYDSMYLTMHTMYGHSDKIGIVPSDVPIRCDKSEVDEARVLTESESKSESSISSRSLNQTNEVTTSNRADTLDTSSSHTSSESVDLNLTDLNNGFSNTEDDGMEREMYSCFLCDFESVVEYNLTRHIREWHSENKDPYRCIHCGTVKHSACEFYSHYRSHIETRLYHCSDCDGRFWQKETLDSHICRPMRIHGLRR